MQLIKKIANYHALFFSSKNLHKFERITVYLALIGFLIHLLLILNCRWEVFDFLCHEEISKDPTSSLYTPFSFILVYEVFLLIYYLPRSFTTSVAKQYEIMALIIIRRIFKDISHFNINEIWTGQLEEKTQILLVDMFGIVVLCLLIVLFYRLKGQRKSSSLSTNINQFIRFKKAMAVLLVPILIGLSIYSLVGWTVELWLFGYGHINMMRDVNDIFYHEFFTLLIFVDVIVLIVSILYTKDYSQLIRNSSFVISTVLIRISFSADYVVNTVILILATTFGVIMLWVYNLYGNQQPPKQFKEMDEV